MSADNSTVKSLVRALSVLECFSVERPELGPSEIGAMLHMQKSTIYNILNTFQQCGYLTKNEQTGKYSLALKLLHFGYIVNSRYSLREMFLPVLSKIANATGELCYFGILSEEQVVYIESAVPAGQMRTRNISGERAPLYCTGLGKAMLAYLPEAQIEKILSRPMKAFTDYTITRPETLRQALEEIRQNGYAADNMEHEFGIRCVAVPVFDSHGQVVAAVSVSGPSPRFDNSVIARDAVIIADALRPLQRCI